MLMIYSELILKLGRLHGIIIVTIALFDYLILISSCHLNV